MANKVEIIFDGVNRTDRAIADMVRDIRQAQRDIASMGTAGELVTDRLSGAFEALGVRSSAAIEKERQTTIRAYQQIKNSGVSSAEEIARAKIVAQRKLAELGAEAKATARKVDEIGTSGQRSGANFGHGITAALGKLLVLELAVTHIGRLLDRLVFDFNSKLETAGLGIAAAYVSAGVYIDDATGKALEGSDALAAAQADARKMTEELQVANFQTIATLDQLVRAYQETLPVAMAKGFDRTQVKEFTSAMVQAAGAIGLSLDMLGEETRSILTGAINPRTSRIATVLGLRNEDVAQYKGNADELFNFLMGKLAAYRAAGIESQKTWAGVWSNSLDLFSQVAAKVGEPLFETVKAELTSISEEIVTIDQASGEIQWSPDFIEGLTTVKNGLANIIAELYRMGMLVDKAGFGLTTVGRFFLSERFMPKEKAEQNQKFFDELEAKLFANYEDSDRKLQELANRMAGLNSDGSPKNIAGKKTTYTENPPPGDPKEEEERKKRVQGYIKAGKEVPVDPWLRDVEDRQKVIEADYRVRAEMEKEHQAELDLYWTESTANWEQQVKDRQEVAERHNQAIAESLTGVIDQMNQFGVQAANNMQNAFAEFLFDPFEEGLGGMLQSFADTLRQMVAQIAASQILSTVFGSMAGSSNPVLAGIGAAFVPQHHAGGKYVPAFHLGGLSRDEGLAVLKKGEVVFDPEQTKLVEGLSKLGHGGGNGTQVNIYEAPGTKASVQSERGADGRELIRVVIDNVADGMARGRFDRVMQQNWGLNRKGS